uniref:Uncharacterized protein n=1 Tax=Phocoena sinus TaxID=42100 RepID=A0A8C9E031_PHOSS
MNKQIKRFTAFCYMLALLLTAALIFSAIWHIIAFDELKTDYRNPIDQTLYNRSAVPLVQYNKTLKLRLKKKKKRKEAWINPFGEKQQIRV